MRDFRCHHHDFDPWRPLLPLPQSKGSAEEWMDEREQGELRVVPSMTSAPARQIVITVTRNAESALGLMFSDFLRWGWGVSGKVQALTARLSEDKISSLADPHSTQ